MGTTTTFTASICAADAADAIARIERRLHKTPGVTITGRVQVRSERHKLWTVEMASDGTTDADSVWVWLTSYGISPSADLGSMWETVRGVGC